MYEIKKDVPIPSPAGKIRYPLLHGLAAKMAVNDCVEVPNEYEAKALVKYLGARREMNQEVGRRYCKGSYRKQDDKFLVWRIN